MRDSLRLGLEALDGGFKIVDAKAIAYVYGHADPRYAGIANSLTLDEARRIASNIAKLPDLLGKVRPDDNIQAVGNLSDERHEAAARRLAEAGCSTHQIASVTGHKTLKEVEHYTQAANQERMAQDAMRAIK
jgi:integrase